MDIADRHALVPLYSFLTDKGQAYEPFAERLWRRLLACEKGSECRICCQFMPFRGLTAHATLSSAKGSYVQINLEDFGDVHVQWNSDGGNRMTRKTPFRGARQEGRRRQRYGEHSLRGIARLTPGSLTAGTTPSGPPGPPPRDGGT